MLETLKYLSLCARIQGADFLQEEKGEVNIVATVVLCGIAVLLAIIFKGEITGLIKDLLNTIKNNANNAVS